MTNNNKYILEELDKLLEQAKAIGPVPPLSVTTMDDEAFSKRMKAYDQFDDIKRKAYLIASLALPKSMQARLEKIKEIDWDTMHPEKEETNGTND